MPPPLLAALFTLFFLALLLIPYSLYILRPFRTLNDSIARVAAGDFSRPLQVDKRSEFSGIAQAFNHMVERIQAMIGQKQRLIADVSHELRSPLARMRVSLELLRKEGKGSAKYLAKAVGELEQLDRLIEHLLEASALELNAAQYPMQLLDLTQVLADSLESHRLILEQHQLDIRMQVPPQPCPLQGNRPMLERALANIFSNLLKYAPAGSQVDISLAVDPAQALLSFRDRGPGVAPAELDKLTEPFYRTDDSRSRRTGGTGLGLAIVRQVMALHQGQLLLELPGDGDGGLIVRLRFPLFPPA